MFKKIPLAVHLQEQYDWSDYPLYHTTFEDFDAMKNILDPEFRYHLALGRLWALMGIGLADSQVILQPLFYLTYTNERKHFITTLF